MYFSKTLLIYHISYCFIFLAACNSPSTSPKSKNISSQAFLEKHGVVATSDWLMDKAKNKSDLSLLHVPISISISDIEQRINQELRDGMILHQDTVFKPGRRNKAIHHKVNVSKSGPFTLSAQNDYIYAELPLNIQVSLKYGRKQDERFLSRAPLETEAAIIIKARTQIGINSDWQPVSQTEIIAYDWVNEPYIDVLGFNVRVTKVAENRIKKLLPRLLPRLDSIAQYRINLEKPIKTAWRIMQKPHQLAEDPPVWLQLDSHAVLISPLKAHNDTLKMSVGMQVKAHTIISETKPLIRHRPLPKISLLENVHESFFINLSGMISYEKATEIASEQLVGLSQSFRGGSYTLKINSIHISGNKNHLILTVGVEGDLNGSITCKGKLQYVPNTEALKVSNFDFDIETNNIIANVANWLQHRSFVKTIQNQLEFPITSIIKEAECFIEEQMYENTIGDKEQIILNGHIERIEPQGIFLSKQGISMVVRAIGEANIEVITVYE